MFGSSSWDTTSFARTAEHVNCRLAILRVKRGQDFLMLALIVFWIGLNVPDISNKEYLLRLEGNVGRFS